MLKKSCLAIMAMLLANSGRAVAQDVTADALFKQGREAVVKGELEKGCSLLAESERLEPSPGAKLNLALCEEELKHPVRAWELLEEVVHALPASDVRVGVAQRHRAQLRAQLAFVAVHVSKSMPGMRIITDFGELTVAKLGTTIAREPGLHTFEISAPGWVGQRRQVLLRAGAIESVQLELVPAAQRAVSASTTRNTKSEPWRSGRLRTLGIAVEGAAVALLATSLTIGALALSEKATASSLCNAQGACTEEGLRSAERGAAFATASTWTFIGATVAGLAGGVLLLVDGQGASNKPVGARLAIKF